MEKSKLKTQSAKPAGFDFCVLSFDFAPSPCPPPALRARLTRVWGKA